MEVRAAWQFYWAMDEADVDTNALMWWKVNGQSSQLRFVAPIARKYMSALATSAVIERVFSRAKRWCRDEKGRMSAFNVEVCTNSGTVLSQESFDLNTLYGDLHASAACGAGTDEPDDE